MSTGTALVNARTPNAAPGEQAGHGKVTYMSPEEQHAAAQACALGPNVYQATLEECAGMLEPVHTGGVERRVGSPSALSVPYGTTIKLKKSCEGAGPVLHPYHRATTLLISANVAHLPVIVAELGEPVKLALLSALADSLGLTIE